MTEPLLLTRSLKRAEVPSAGTSLVIEASDDECRRIAAAFGLEACDSLAATLRVRPDGQDGLIVRGHLTADVTYRCVVTLEPVPGRVEEPIDVRFAPPAGRHRASTEVDVASDVEDPPEPLIGDAADLGPVVTEHLALGLDPYPRAPGAALPVLGDNGPKSGPFSYLASLRARTPPKG
jgi:uncharacterized protein